VVLICLDFSPQLVQITINLQEPSVEIRLAGACSSHLLYALTVAGVPSELSIENIRAKCQSIPILNKIQNLSTFALSIERHQLIMSAHNLFSNHEFRRRQVISEQEVSTIHEFISKMTLLHHYTASTITAQGCNDQRKLKA
jgi:hypothetical protein